MTRQIGIVTELQPNSKYTIQINDESEELNDVQAIGRTSEFTFEQNLERTKPYELSFTEIMPEVLEGTFDISFEDQGNSQITFNEVTLSVLVDPSSPIGSYQVQLIVKE